MVNVKFIAMCCIFSFPLYNASALNEHTDSREYSDELVTILQIMWGDEFLSTGGNKVLERMIDGMNLTGKKVLDFGCGIGGPAFYLAERHYAEVVGVDVDPILVQQARSNLQHKDNALLVSFEQIHGSFPLPFADETFDVIFSKEVVLHVSNKAALFAEFNRILKKGGNLVIFDWFHASVDYSADMKKFVTIDGLTFYLVTVEEYMDLVSKAHFSTITNESCSEFALQETQRDYAYLGQEGGKKIESYFGKKMLDECFESWGLQETVLKNGELKIMIIRAEK